MTLPALLLDPQPSVASTRKSGLTDRTEAGNAEHCARRNYRPLVVYHEAIGVFLPPSSFVFPPP